MTSQKPSPPLRVGIIGMGGFAGDHHNAVSRLESSGDFCLVCTCDPRMDAFAERQQVLKFSERGVRTFTAYEEMLDACRSELDLVTIPTPIPLHAPMHRACVERGLPVYLEKPPTLDYAELERMITVESAATRETFVAFNFIVEAERQALKQRLVAGEFGALRHVTAFALWPRNNIYFTRADWAGRLQKDGRLILDSCIGNAMAHQVHNALFWCGTDDFWAWGEITKVQAELYRAHRIESLDTAFVTATTRQGPELRLAMTHACFGTQTQEECVVCEKAVIRYNIANSSPDGLRYSVTWNDGRKETGGLVKRDLVKMNLLSYGAYLRGKSERPLTRLADSRPFVQLNNLAYIAAGAIHTIPAAHITTHSDGFLGVAGLPEAVHAFIETGRFPSTQPHPWASPGGTATPEALGTLERVVKAMVNAREA